MATGSDEQDGPQPPQRQTQRSVHHAAAVPMTAASGDDDDREFDGVDEQLPRPARNSTRWISVQPAWRASSPTKTSGDSRPSAITMLTQTNQPARPGGQAAAGAGAGAAVAGGARSCAFRLSRV